MNKTITLDRTKLLGFKLEPARVSAQAARSDAAIGAKVGKGGTVTTGAKIGKGFGITAGAKIGKVTGILLGAKIGKVEN